MSQIKFIMIVNRKKKDLHDIPHCIFCLINFIQTCSNFFKKFFPLFFINVVILLKDQKKMRKTNKERKDDGLHIMELVDKKKYENLHFNK